MTPVTQKATNIPPFIVMDVLERAHELEREGRHIIHLEVGEPDFATPPCICEAAVKALQEERTHYTHSLGLPELVYGDREHSILEFTDRSFVLNGFSKLYAMTGWRLGYVIAPVEFVRPIQKIQQNFFISAGSISHWAGLAALTKAEKDVEKMRAVYDERRRYMVGRLREMGFGLSVEPGGGPSMCLSMQTTSPMTPINWPLRYLKVPGWG